MRSAVEKCRKTYQPYILMDVEPLMDSKQLATLKVVLTVECTKYSINEQKNEVVIYDETSDISRL